MHVTTLTNSHCIRDTGKHMTKVCHNSIAHKHWLLWVVVLLEIDFIRERPKANIKTFSSQQNFRCLDCRIYWSFLWVYDYFIRASLSIRLFYLDYEDKTQHTCSGPLGGTGTLILVAVALFLELDTCEFFFSSNKFSELLVRPCPLLSPGLWCRDLSSSPLGGDCALPSLETHLFSSYLKETVIVRCTAIISTHKEDWENLLIIEF